MNRHDKWLSYRGEILAKIADLEIPATILRTERSFETFLTLGHIPGVAFELNQLSAQQCGRLFNLVTSYFDSRAEALTALEKRRLAGFKRASAS